MDLKGGFTELGHARTALREWSAELKQALKAHPQVQPRMAGD